jgi:uncharacterized SAM-binding protein YcdF (DUF218 family)
MNSALLRNFICGLVSLYLIITINGCIYSSKTQHRLFRKIENTPFDIIIVPGVPFENGVWHRTMKGRVYWAKYLYDKGIAKNILFSGSAVYSPYYEGKIMALYATALGVPAANVYTEIKAEHSTENMYYSYKLVKKLGFKRVALASDPFQSKQLRRYIRKKISDRIAIIPFVTDTLKTIEPAMIDPPIDYRQAFKKDFIPINKRESPWKRWRGTRGKNIDEKAYE